MGSMLSNKLIDDSNAFILIALITVYNGDLCRRIAKKLMSDFPDFYKSKVGYEIVQRGYDEALASWSIAPQSVIVETRIAKTHILIAGERCKPALFYFHGWNGNAAGNHTELDLQRLTKDYCVYMPDTPGQLGRSEAVRHDTKTNAYADWAHDMLDELRIERATFSGVSGGGYLALKATAHLGNRVERLLGVVSHGIPPASRPPLRFWLVVIRAAMTGKRGWHYFAQQMGGPNPVSEEFKATIISINQHYKPRGNPMPLHDDELRAIQCPATFLFAKHDITMNVQATVDRAQKLIPQADVRVLENQGHMLSVEGMRLVNDVLVKWAASPDREDGA